MTKMAATVVCMHARDGNGMQVWEEMKTSGIQTNSYVYVALINACERVGDWQHAVLVFKEMQVSFLCTVAYLIVQLCYAGGCAWMSEKPMAQLTLVWLSRTLVHPGLTFSWLDCCGRSQPVTRCRACQIGWCDLLPTATCSKAYFGDLSRSMVMIAATCLSLQ
jgi:pentatricopeptide repeat protein